MAFYLVGNLVTRRLSRRFRKLSENHRRIEASAELLDVEGTSPAALPKLRGVKGEISDAGRHGVRRQI